MKSMSSLILFQLKQSIYLQMQDLIHQEYDLQVQTDNQNILVQIYSDSIVLRKESSIMTISRKTCLAFNHEPMQQHPSESFHVCALYGFLQLQANTYLLLVLQSTYICQFLNNPCFRVNKIVFQPLLVTPRCDAVKDKHYIDGVSQVLNCGHLYYSNTYDLTQSFNGKNQQQMSRNQYFWNQRLVEEIPNQWVVKFISGILERHKVGQGVDLMIISRRDKRRTGRRWHCRGTDPYGNAANTIQTEQLLIKKEVGIIEVFSYIQIRGSIPVSWYQKPNLSWRPEHKLIGSQQDRREQFLEHFKMLQGQYKNIVIVNLVAQRGLEKVMSGAYSQNFIVTKLDNVKYFEYDYNKELKSGKQACNRKLLTLLEEQLNNIGYSHYKNDKNGGFIQLSKQNGVFRINCVDCIDRTNLVQTLLSKAVLYAMLNSQHFHSRPPIKSNWNDKYFQKQIEAVFHVIWCHNGDQLSQLYTGTPALKTDQVLYGHQTFRGQLRDAKSSITRHLLGNFEDARIQDYIDVSLKYIQPIKQPFESSVTLMYVYLLMIIGVPIWIFYGYKNGSADLPEKPAGIFERVFILVISIWGIIKTFKGMLPNTVRDNRSIK